MGQVSSEIEVSIIIVNYNAIKILDDCLESLFKFSKNFSFEVIVVDNNSNDGDISAVTRKYPNVQLIINDTNVGFSAANNIGIDKAKGKYFLFLNNDTVFTENTIYRVLEFAQSRSEKIFVGCRLLNSDGSTQDSVVEFPSLWNAVTENLFLYKLFPRSKIFNKYYQNLLDGNSHLEVDVIRGAFMFCDAGSVKELNGFDERFFFYSEETDLCYRFKKSGGRIYFMRSTKIIHLEGATADRHLWFKFKNQTTGKIQFYQKHFSGFYFASLIIVHFIGLFLRGVLFSLAGISNKKMRTKGFYFFKQLTVYPINKFK